MKGGSMLRMVLVMMAGLVFGCGSTDGDGEKSITPGTYETQDWREDPEHIQRNQVTYESESYTFKEIIGGCIACQMTGNWRAASDQIVYSNIRIQCRSGCADPFNPANLIPDYSVRIRNVSASGYEAFLEPFSGEPGAWRLFKAL